MRNEKRLIDAKPLMKNGWHLVQTGKSNRFLRSMSLADVPTVDAVEVVHGRWINIVDYGGGKCFGFCSHCAAEQEAQNATALKAFHKYCRWCGAKMDGERKDND